MEFPQVKVREVIRQVARVKERIVAKTVSKLIIEYVARVVEFPQATREEKIVKIPEVVMVEVVKQVPKTVIQFVDKQVGKVVMQYVTYVEWQVDAPFPLMQKQAIPVPQVISVESTTQEQARMRQGYPTTGVGIRAPWRRPALSTMACAGAGQGMPGPSLVMETLTHLPLASRTSLLVSPWRLGASESL